MAPKDVVAPNTGLGLLGTVVVSLNEFNGVIFPGEKLKEFDPKVAFLCGSGGGSLFKTFLSGFLVSSCVSFLFSCLLLSILRHQLTIHLPIS